MRNVMPNAGITNLYDSNTDDVTMRHMVSYPLMPLEGKCFCTRSILTGEVQASMEMDIGLQYFTPWVFRECKRWLLLAILSHLFESIMCNTCGGLTSLILSLDWRLSFANSCPPIRHAKTPNVRKPDVSQQWQTFTACCHTVANPDNQPKRSNPLSKMHPDEHLSQQHTRTW